MEGDFPIPSERIQMGSERYMHLKRTIKENKMLWVSDFIPIVSNVTICLYYYEASLLRLTNEYIMQNSIEKQPGHFDPSHQQGSHGNPI